MRKFRSQLLLTIAVGVIVVLAGNKVSRTAGVSGSHQQARDFSKLEPGEKFPGGQATSLKSNNDANAFSNASGNMPVDRVLDFKGGNRIFRLLWVSPPSSMQSADGLGPLFNARSCQRCHLKDGRGHPPRANFPDDDATSMFLRLSIPPQTADERAQIAARRINAVPDPTYGGQLQDFAVEGHSAEGKVHIDYEDVPFTFPDGERATLRKPRYSVDKLAYGPLHADVMTSPRVANQMIGLGLLEAIPEGQIRALSDPDDKNSDGVSGRPNEVWSIVGDKPALGRFGWKAGAPSVRQQSAEAFAGDIGISNPLVRTSAGDCTTKQTECVDALNGDSEKEGVEAGQNFLDLVTFYSQNLAVPRRRDPDNPDVLAGKKYFHEAGCAVCHRPKFVTGTSEGQPHLSNQLIWPYTDLLLHDMGEGIADNRPEGVANGREWRTAPLWGIGLTPVVNGHSFYLHDGRARNLTEAILWHDGEARSARDAFAALPKEDRARLITFLKSL